MSFDLFTGVIASKYAKTLYAIAESEGRIPEFLEGIRAVSKSLESLKDREKVFKRFSLMPKEGEQLVDSLADEVGLCLEIRNFLKVILSNHRFSEILDICRSFENVCDEMKGRVFHVTFAKNFPEEKKQEVRDLIRRSCSDDLNVKIFEEKDDSLIGGFQVRHKSKLVDASIKSKLSRLKVALKGGA